MKKAFRSLARQYHPDKNKADDAEEKFREIAEGEFWEGGVRDYVCHMMVVMLHHSDIFLHYCNG